MVWRKTNNTAHEWTVYVYTYWRLPLTDPRIAPPKIVKLKAPDAFVYSPMFTGGPLSVIARYW